MGFVVSMPKKQHNIRIYKSTAVHAVLHEPSDHSSSSSFSPFLFWTSARQRGGRHRSLCCDDVVRCRTCSPTLTRDSASLMYSRRRHRSPCSNAAVSGFRIQLDTPNNKLTLADFATSKNLKIWSAMSPHYARNGKNNKQSIYSQKKEHISISLDGTTLHNWSRPEKNDKAFKYIAWPTL